MTFYVKTDDTAFTHVLTKELENNGLESSSDFPVDFVFLSGKHAYNRNAINLKKSSLSNTIHEIDITNKGKLHSKFSEYDFIMPTNEASKSSIRILKPTDSYAGKDIIVVTSSEEIEQHKKANPHAGWILQDYIQTPALKDGYKFHLRVPILVTTDHVYLFNRSPYYLAKKHYKQDNWSDAEIHDTHFSERKYFFPDDLPDGWKRASNKGIGDIVHEVFKKIQLKSDWNGKTPYYLFGADVMFNKRKPILLEVNYRIGLKQMDFVIPSMVSILLGKGDGDFIEVI